MGFQQSTQRGLAEFALIVAGVLVALGLEGAWANRQDRVNEADYLVDMLQEARANARTVRDVLQVSDAKRAALARALSLLAPEVPQDSAAAFLEGLLQGSGIAVVPQLRRAVFEDLQGAGRLSLIRDDVARRQIIGHYSFVAAMMERQARWEGAIDPRLHSLASRNAPAGTVLQSGPRIRVLNDPQSAASIQQAVRELSSDPTLRFEIRATWRALDAEHSDFQRLLDLIEEHVAVLSEFVEQSQ